MLNRKLASMRTLYNIKQSILADILGVTINTFSSKERGATPFTQKEMILTTNYFKQYDSELTMDDIFFIDEVNQSVTNMKGA